MTLVVALLASPVAAQPRRSAGDSDAYRRASPRVGAPARPLRARRMAVSGWERRRGVPSLLSGRATLSAGGQPDARADARRALGALGRRYGLSARALADMRVERVQRLPGGAHLVLMEQSVDGVPVYRSGVAMLVDRQHRLHALGGAPFDTRPAHGARFTFDAPDAVLAALEALFPSALFSLSRPSDVLDEVAPAADQSRRFTLAAAGAPGPRVSRPFRVIPVFFPLPDRLVPAYQIEAWPSDGASSGMEELIISAEDGALLLRQDRVEHDAFTYRVYADPFAPFTPHDAPIEDYTPHPTGLPDGIQPVFVASSLITMEGFNTNPSGGSDPWLPHDAQELVGNNLDVFTDRERPDGYTPGEDIRALISSPGVFDHAYDPFLDANHDDAQTQSAMVQFFYVVNWLHDYFYDSGFDEAAGNAQLDNLGRGGVEGDPMEGEVQDFQGTNNASMTTPLDGSSPIMELHLWDGRSDVEIVADAMTFEGGGANFGPEVYELTGLTAEALDDTLDASDACEPITNDIAGKIALVDRGNCSFIIKVDNVEAAGAIGVIIVNYTPGDPPLNMIGPSTATVEIPALMATYEGGAYLRSRDDGVPVNLVRRESSAVRAGSFDSTIVAHEWGHYLFRRLLPACNTVMCRSASEGFSDVLALFMALRPWDDLDGVYPIGVYSTFYREGNEYYGVRRIPYSVDRAVNDLRFRHVQEGEPLPETTPMRLTGSPNHEVHNAGEVWASIVFEAFVNLVRRSEPPVSAFSFEEAKRRMADYLVAGMQLTPTEATFTEQRRALLSAVAARDMLDYEVMAAAFASRGMGACATSPERYSRNMVGVVEDYDLHPLGVAESAAIVPGSFAVDCDSDDFIDLGEEAGVRVQVASLGETALTDGVLRVASADPAVRFPAGDSFPLPDIGVGETHEVDVAVGLAGAVDPGAPVILEAWVESGDPCIAPITAEFPLRMELDAEPSNVEGFDITPYFAQRDLSGMPYNVWSFGPSPFDEGRSSAFAVETVQPTDTALELPPVFVSSTPGTRFMFAFEHRYDLEVWSAPRDGAMVEYSVDGGASWRDVATLIDPGYTGVIESADGNPLAGREAWTGQNALWPDMDTVELDFGEALAGETVRFRFRFATDFIASNTGWEIDSIELRGTDDTPFLALVPDTGGCGAPVADAGEDQLLLGRQLSFLDGTGSFDTDGDTLTYAWTQVSGPALIIEEPGSPIAHFEAPSVELATTLVFELEVSDGSRTSTDRVEVVIEVGTWEGPPAGDGCGCRITGAPTERGLPLPLAALFIGVGVLFCRRRVLG